MKIIFKTVQETNLMGSADKVQIMLLKKLSYLVMSKSIRNTSIIFTPALYTSVRV